MGFLGFRKGRGHSSSSSESTASDTSHESLSHAVATNVFQINTVVPTFQGLVQAIGTSKDNPGLREKLHKTRLHIVQLVKETSFNLKALSYCDNSPDILADAKLARDFKASLEEFQKAQIVARERETNCMPPDTGAEKSLANEGEKEDLESQPFLSEQKRLLMLMDEIGGLEGIVEEQKMKEMQSQIAEISAIYKDVAVLMNEQDMGRNQSNTATASEAQLVMVSKTSGSTWWWRSLIVLVLFAIIVFLAILFLSSTNKNMLLEGLLTNNL